MTSPGYSREQALEKHRELLLAKRRRLDSLLALVNKTIQGENTMSFEEFDKTELKNQKNAYAEEVKARWGDTAAYRESQARAAAYTDEDRAALRREMEELLASFAALRDQPPGCEAAQTLVAAWQDYITRSYYPCTAEILAGLASMYVSDPRFTQNIDRHGQGTAAFLSQAIALYTA